MSVVNLETLSAVHIGSGALLKYNTDFVVSKIDGESSIIVTDDRKIVELIGAENIDKWVLSIENDDPTIEFVKTYSPKSSPMDFAQRVLKNYAKKIPKTDTLKETIHNGLKLPYIPGSSIKGAIRTAVLATLAKDTPGKEALLTNNRNNRVSAEGIENLLFGKDPNNDIFRFLRVGDAYFEAGSTIALKMINLNMRSNDTSLIDSSMPQLIEAIPEGEFASFQMNLVNDYYNWAKPKARDLAEMPKEMQSIPELFTMINNHTKSLLEEELSFWEKEENYSGNDDYLSTLEELLIDVKSCKEGKSCVLRVGHGSGWSFITGGWTKSLDNFKDTVVPIARRNNRAYLDYDFPKSRRIDEDSYVLGFVRLSLE